MGFTWSHTPETVKQNIYKIPSGCWLWMGTISTQGYGRVLYQGKRFMAHRLSFSLFKGEIPDGSLVLHSCDNPRCVNPMHLHLGTAKDNTREMLIRKRNRPRHGILNPSAKMTWEQIYKIRERLTEGESCTNISRDYNVQPSYISRIKNNIIWKENLDDTKQMRILRK